MSIDGAIRTTATVISSTQVKVASHPLFLSGTFLWNKEPSPHG